LIVSITLDKHPKGPGFFFKRNIKNCHFLVNGPKLKEFLFLFFELQPYKSVVDNYGDVWKKFQLIGLGRLKDGNV